MNFGSKLCPLECTKSFSKIWPSNLLFDPPWPNFKFDLDILMINILTQFHDIRNKICTLEGTLGFSKVWPSNLVFDPTWPSFKHDLDIIMITILTQFHELWIKNVPVRVYTRFF